MDTMKELMMDRVTFLRTPLFIPNYSEVSDKDISAHYTRSNLDDDMEMWIRANFHPQIKLGEMSRSGKYKGHVKMFALTTGAAPHKFAISKRDTLDFSYVYTAAQLFTYRLFKERHVMASVMNVLTNGPGIPGPGKRDYQEKMNWYIDRAIVGKHKTLTNMADTLSREIMKSYLAQK